MSEPDDWHCVWLDPEPDGFTVKCIPHGEIGVRDTHYRALVLGYLHDEAFRGAASQKGYQ